MGIITVQNTESIPPHSLNLPSTLAIVSGPMALTIVADDLTGACDAGTLFAGKAPVPVTVWPTAPVAAEVAVVDTESRHLDRAAAAARVSAAAAHVVDVIRAESDRPLAWVPLAEVRAGALSLAGRLARLAGMITVADAETDEDLDTIVEAALALERAPLLAGSAGLAQPLAARLGLRAGRTSLPGGRWLIVAGSLHS